LAQRQRLQLNAFNLHQNQNQHLLSPPATPVSPASPRFCKISCRDRNNKSIKPQYGRPKQQQRSPSNPGKSSSKYKKNIKIDRLSYEPSSAITPIRLKRNVYIAAELTEAIISRIKANFNDAKELYSWMDMNATIQFNRNMNQINGNTKIFNFGFIDKDTDDELFCIVERRKSKEQNEEKNQEKQGIYSWEMNKKLYTKEMIMSEFNMAGLPTTTDITADEQILLQMMQFVII